MMFILSPHESLPLSDLCKRRVGALLSDEYYYPIGKAAAYGNPFEYVPSATINELFEMVMRARRNIRSSIADMLRPLLTSGRLTELVLGFRDLVPKDLIEIFGELDSHALHIRKISFGSFGYPGGRRQDEPSFIQAVMDFVPKCKNIEYLSIPCPAFEMDLINELPKLEVLIIQCFGARRFKTSTNVLHHNLTQVKIDYVPDARDLVKFLTYCPNLTSLKNNITEALRLLHSKQLSDRTPSKVYSLQDYTVDDTALDIASKICPMTKILRLLFTTTDFKQQHRYFDAFKSMETLVAVWDDYHQPTESLPRYPVLDRLLKCVGQRLKHLTVQCVRVDFETLGVCCPNLVSLKVYFQKSHYIKNPSESCFSKLESLFLLHRFGGQMDPKVLPYLLCNCKQISEICLNELGCLTDKLLDNILIYNGLQDLRKLYLTECSLTKRGILLLLTNCNRLEVLYLSSVLLPAYQTIRQVVLDIYPFARTPGKDDYLYPILDSYPIEKRPSRSRKHTLQE